MSGAPMKTTWLGDVSSALTLVQGRKKYQLMRRTFTEVEGNSEHFEISHINEEISQSKFWRYPFKGLCSKMNNMGRLAIIEASCI